MTLAVAIVLAGGAAWGISRWIYARGHEITDNAQIEGHIVPVLPKVGGYVTRVYVEDNQLVQAGDTLVVLDPRDYQARLEQARAELQTAQVAAARNGTAMAEMNQASAESATADARIVAALAAY